jgi:hypothetical protein
MIEFNCEHCGWKLSVSENHAGEKGRCQKCNQEVFVPGIDSSLFDVPQKTSETGAPIVQKSSTDESLEGLKESDESMGAEPVSPEVAATSKMPWFLDAFLYPFGISGFIHLIGLWLLIFLFCPLIMAVMGLGTEYAPIVYFLPVAYMLYYFTECIRDAASGGRRAPDSVTGSSKSDKWDYISQLLVVVGSIAVCFLPVAVYYIITERSDLIYWLLLAFGGFFFPMVLLAVVLFDSFNALNPFLIISSIFSVFVPYCALVIIFFVSSYVCLRINSRFYSFRPMPIVPFFLRAVQLYMINVAVGILGRFYHRHADKLNWEV